MLAYEYRSCRLYIRLPSLQHGGEVTWCQYISFDKIENSLLAVAGLRYAVANPVIWSAWGQDAWWTLPNRRLTIYTRKREGSGPGGVRGQVGVSGCQAGAGCNVVSACVDQ